MNAFLLSPACILVALTCLGSQLWAIEAIERRLPPVGLEIPADIQTQVQTRLARLRDSMRAIADHPSRADAEIMLKAVDFAIRHREIYKKEHFGLLDSTLTIAEQRIESLQQNRLPWAEDQLTVRGFHSRIDGSPQPYGLVLPDDLPADRPVPLYVWLHGRGDRSTDIHFIRERLARQGQISLPGAIVLHPFGRQCIGYKSAGEIDVMEAIDHVKTNYNIDSDRVVLMGFSMGGAGAWHLGAHYTDQFAAVSPGAGFAETSRYQRLSPAQIADTPWYERRLWSLYDVPNYVRNYFNVPVTCYSGEMDKQIQAARVMEEAFAQFDRKLDHVIGPGMGHKYDDASLAEILSKMKSAAAKGRQPQSPELYLQTRTLRYPKMHWVHIERLEQHWNDSTVDVSLHNDTAQITTRNVQQLRLDPIPSQAKQVELDGTIIRVNDRAAVFSKTDQWRLGALETTSKYQKRPGLQGPIDDAFFDRFLVVTPTKESSEPEFDQWVQFELQHLRDRWSALFRGNLPEKPADQITARDIERSHLIVFGDATNNEVASRIVEELPDVRDQLLKVVRTAGNNVPVPVVSFIHPNPLNPDRYVVFNSGPTFREAHDRTNSLQNPKLPDWAIFDIRSPPDAERAGKVIAAGFFDEDWRMPREQPVH